MSIATKLASILEYKGDIKDAIERKGVTVGDAPLSEYSDRIDDIECPNEDLAEWKDVNFIDYDGTCILSYTAEEFLELTAMPTYPMTHPGLTFVEWNWTLSVAQNYVWKYKYLVVGASLNSSDGATRVTINIQDDSLLTVKLAYRQSKTNGVLIDWGDGSTPQRYAGTDFTAVANRIPHTYPQKGRYTITYTPDAGCNFSPTTGSYGGPFGYYYGSQVAEITNCVESIIYGTVYNGWNNLFTSSTSLKEVVCNASQIYGIMGNTYFAYNLKGLVIPKFPRAASVTLSSPAYGAYEMKAISFPENATLLSGSTCSGCIKVKTFTIPPNINVGTNNWSNVFYNCFMAEHIVFPEGMTKIYNSTCGYCFSLKEIIIPDTVTVIGQSITAGSAFSYCLSATKLKLSNNLTIIPASSFAWCVSLPEIIVPEGVTQIGNNAFQFCQSAKKIVLPSTITSIGNNAFNQTYDQANQKLEGFYIKATTPPTAGTTILQNTGVPNFTIYVPKGSLSAYQSATNWSTYSARMQEYDFTRIECIFNVNDTSTPINILSSTSSIKEIEIDGVVQSSISTTYTFDTTGEHIVKYTLWDTTTVPSSFVSNCTDLIDVYIPSNITTISTSSFENTGLKKITIQKNITNINSNAFKNCSNLKTVIMESTTPPTLQTNVFSGNSSERKIYTLASCLSTYKAASNWSTYASDIVEMKYWGI